MSRNRLNRRREKDGKQLHKLYWRNENELYRIDASKGKSTIAVIRPGGEVFIPPFEINHIISELGALTERLRSLDGKIHVVMESTGNYHAPSRGCSIMRNSVYLC